VILLAGGQWFLMPGSRFSSLTIRSLQFLPNDHRGEPDGGDTEAFFAALTGADGADVAVGSIRILTGGLRAPG
jgi:hypothetical protein